MDMELVFLCLMVFFGRIVDVALGTLRTILTVRTKSALAALCGFVEVTIWFLVVRQALTSSRGEIFIALSFAGGFALGTFFGGKLAGRILKGNLEVKVVTSFRDDELIAAIRAAGFAVSVVNVNKSEYGSEKYMLFAEIENSRLDELKEAIYAVDPKAFVMVRETRFVYNGFFQKK